MKKRGRIQRQLIVFSSMADGVSDLAGGLWRGGGTKRWLAPLAIFLCVTGALLVLAAGVEALAPFIYAIF
jgi:hypothetical protein